MLAGVFWEVSRVLLGTHRGVPGSFQGVAKRSLGWCVLGGFQGVARCLPGCSRRFPGCC